MFLQHFLFLFFWQIPGPSSVGINKCAVGVRRRGCLWRPLTNNLLICSQAPRFLRFFSLLLFRFFASELLVFAEGGFLYIFFSLSEIIFSGGILLVCRKQGCGALEHAGGTTSGPRKFVANGKRVTSIYSNGERRTLRWQGFVVATDLLFVSFCCLLMLHTFNNLSEGNNGNSTDNGEG